MILLEVSRQLKNSHALLSKKNRVGIPYPLTFGQGMYVVLAAQSTEYSKKEIVEYNLDLHTARPRMDPYGKLKKMVERQYAHLPHIEHLWANCQDDKEVRMRAYMRMTT